MKRKLVDVWPDNYRKLNALRKNMALLKFPVPTVTQLVNSAVSIGIDEIAKNTTRQERTG